MVPVPQQTTTLFFCASLGFSGRAIFISVHPICVMEVEFMRASESVDFLYQWRHSCHRGEPLCAAGKTQEGAQKKEREVWREARLGQCF